MGIGQKDAAFRIANSKADLRIAEIDYQRTVQPDNRLRLVDAELQTQLQAISYRERKEAHDRLLERNQELVSPAELRKSERAMIRAQFTAERARINQETIVNEPIARERKRAEVRLKEAQLAAETLQSKTAYDMRSSEDSVRRAENHLRWQQNNSPKQKTASKASH